MVSSWAQAPVVGFDTETTGVDPSRDRIVSAAVVRRHGTRTTTCTWLLDPGVEIPTAAVEVHGVTTEEARVLGRPPRTALDEIAGQLADALRHGEPVVAYNATFDLTLLDAELQRHGLPTLRERVGGPVAPVLDPMVLDRRLDPGREGPRRLADLCRHYAVPTGELHRADVDVLATLDVLEAQRRTFPVLDRTPVAELHELQAATHRAWVADVVARREAEGHPVADLATAWPLPLSA